ncbi:hypothetical protein SDC9_162355 [bioreactor metagenome]|uniref:Histidinol-phosphatase n=1 Tax=bioreactor metagenome TaxID=1076179 RepID=A0A645FMX9_9ZZZZ
MFKILREKGRGIELNTSGMRQKLGEPMPPVSLLKLYRDCGGEIVTVGSDAHRSCDVGKGIPQGYDMLKEAGFSYVTIYKQRKPEFIRLK